MFKKILVANDGSKLSGRAINAACDLASKFKSKVKIVYVIDQRVFYQPHDIVLPSSSPYFKILEDLKKIAEKAQQDASRIAQKYDIEVETEILEGSVVDEVIEAAKSYKADLLVIGAHGEAAKHRGLLGSTAQSLSYHAPCSLLLVRF